MAQKRRDPFDLERPGDFLDLNVYNEGTAFNVGAHLDDSLPPDSPRRHFSFSQAAEAGVGFALEIPQDDSYNVRFRLGDPDPREAAEWTGRVEGWLDLSGGWVGCGHGPPVRVPPGHYRVEVCCYLPHGSAVECLERAMGRPRRVRRHQDLRPEPFRAYWRRTRPHEPVPPWLVALTAEGEPEKGDPPYDGGPIEGMVEFVVRLTELTGNPQVVRVGKNGVAPFDTWAMRVPAACPEGIVADLRNLDR